MKYKYVFLIVVIAFELFALSQWFTCRQLQAPFHFSSSDLSLQLDDVIHNDGGMSPTIVRMFHNKLTGGGIYVLKDYLAYFDEQFLLHLLSLIGLFGLLCGVYYCVWKGIKRKIVLPIFFCMIIFPFFEIFTPQIVSPIKIIILIIPFQLLSLFGYLTFLKQQKTTTIFITTFILSILSVGYIVVFAPMLYQMCDKL